MPRLLLAAARRIYLLSGCEHEWLLCPQGHVTGRLAVEVAITPQTEELFQPGMAVTWTRIPETGEASGCSIFIDSMTRTC